MSERNYRIDALKGIASLAVVVYHFGGYLPFGYLGVDVFLVIGGYLMMKSIIRLLENQSFHYWKFVTGRVTRLWFPALVMAALALAVGYFTMLPDDFENLAQSVIATNVFANNILACITTKNYWDIANVFKPLMHTWYLGVLMQAYIILPFVFWGVIKITKGNRNALKAAIWVITCMSLVAYLAPVATAAQKFYYLPFRIFEITAGCAIAFVPSKALHRGKFCCMAETICVMVILAALCINLDFAAPSIKLLCVVIATTALLYIFENTTCEVSMPIKVIAAIGKRSLSVYLCHQIVVAYLYYFVTDNSNIGTLALFLMFVAVCSALTYYLVEKPVNAMAKKNVLYVLIPSFVLFLATSILSGVVYLNAGVVRDVPELGIERENVHRGMHAEYCDIPYAWDRDFSESDKVKIVVIGDSFGRDWANILNESSISNEIEISYIYPYSQAYLDERSDRLMEADIVFRSISSSRNDISDELPSIVPHEKLYIIGYKNFGSSNGIIYNRRGNPNYFDQSIWLDNTVLSNNRILHEQYEGHYIDMIAAVQNEDGSIRVFTDDQHFISQDCRHLTKYGAQYYARILDLSWIVSGKK